MARQRANRGFFQDGKWLCDCDPRLPANHFQAKKGKPQNVGKWFYTCQKPTQSKDRCGFFLWQSDAAPREAAALQSNSRTEPTSAARHAPTPSKRGIIPPTVYAIDTTPSESARKRSRPGDPRSDEGDEFGLDQGDSMFEHELDRVMTALETPRKAARTGLHVTPSRRLRFVQESTVPGLVTPKTEGRFDRDPFHSRFAEVDTCLPASSMGRGLGGERASLGGTPTPSWSPLDTPTRGGTPNSGGPCDVEKDVMEVLCEQKVRLSGPASEALKKVLRKHANECEGHRRGRDVLRLEVKAKEARLASLEQHHVSIGAALEADKAARQFLEWQAEHGDE